MVNDGTLPVPARSVRLAELDGLRGWAALWVVVFHLGWETFGVAVPGFRNPVSAAFNGSLAVTVFFVLSAEALSSGYFSGRGMAQVVGLAVKRLPRLSIPVFFCLLLTYVVARLGLAADVARAARLVDRTDWLGMMNPAAISLKSLVKFPLIDVYASSAPNFDRVPFLWTMNVEMLGSLLVFVLVTCHPRMRHFDAVVMLLGAVLLLNASTANLGDFCFGVVLSRWRQSGVLRAWAAHARARRVAFAAMPCLLALSAIAMMAGKDARVAPVLAPLLVLAMSLTPSATRFLSTRASRWLGHVSFPLYLVQYPVIVSFTASAIVATAAHGGLTPERSLAIVAASCVACLIAAMLFAPVEAWTKSFGQRLGRLLVKAPEQAIASV